MGVEHITIKQIFRISSLIFTFFYILFMPQNEYIMKLESYVIIVLSLILLYKTRNDLRMFISFLFLSYNLYSIVVGEYLIGGLLGIPITTVKTDAVYYILLRIVFIFTLLLCVFLDSKSKSFQLTPISNPYLYMFFLVLILVIIVFGIDRSYSANYKVSINPLYEYGVIIFLFAFYTSGSSQIKKFFLVLLSLIYILQDYYYGGRISSLQLMILTINLYFIQYLNTRKILSLAGVGLLVNNIVAFLRNTNNSSADFKIIFFVKKIISNYFVFDTSVYSYYASATHIATLEYFYLTREQRLSSFFNFVKAIFIGSKNDSGNLTRFISSNYYLNLGGGFFPSYFYFWFGWSGVILSATLIALLLNKLSEATYENEKNKDIKKIVLLISLTYMPRWLIYNPLMLFRPIFFSVLIYSCINVFHNKLKF